MCGHYAGTLGGSTPDPEAVAAQFETETAHYSLQDFPVISIYNSGSVLNPDEIPFEALRTILEKIRPVAGPLKVILESRAEYVTSDLVEELAGVLGPGKTLSIAMGLETLDDGKRDLCVNKGCTFASLERAVASLDGKALSQIYVFFGLPFLTEREALEDTVTSVIAARDMGADEIHIEPATLQRHTLTWELARAGLYRLPSLRSLNEVLRRLFPDIRPYVSPFMHMPRPDIIPEGCPVCSGRLVRGLIEGYNVSRDVSALDDEPCGCIDGWLRRLEETDERPLALRVADSLDCLETSGSLAAGHDGRAGR